MSHAEAKEVIQFFSQVASPSEPQTQLVSLLNSVCTDTDWHYGEFWVPQTDCEVLQLSPTDWAVDSNLGVQQTTAWIQFQLCSRGFLIDLGEGLPGRVWQSQQPEWLTDASAQSETYFLRNQIAKAFNVKAGLGVPLIAHSQVVGVAMFFMSEARQPDAALIERTEAAIAQFSLLTFSK